MSCIRCEELKEWWKRDKSEAFLKEAQEHINSGDHTLALLTFTVDKDDPSKGNVTGYVLRPPIKFIKMTFTVDATSDGL